MSAQAPASIALTSEIHPLRPQVGQVMELRLTATWPASVDQVAPRFDTWSGPFEVVDVDAGVRQLTNEQRSQVWLIHLRTFDIGRVTIGGLRVDFEQVSPLRRLSAQTDDLLVDSVAPAVEPGGSVRPMKDVVEPPRDVADYAVAVATTALAALASVSLVVWLISCSRLAFDRTRLFSRRRALRALRRRYRRRPTDVESFYSDVSHTTRRLFEATFGIPGTVLSSTEIVAALRAAVRPGEPLERVSGMLAAVDAVRFGGRIPTDAEMQEVLALTQSLLLDRGFLATVSAPGSQAASRVS